MKSLLRWLGMWAGLLIAVVIAESISSAPRDTADTAAMILFFLAVFAFFWPLLKLLARTLVNPSFWLAVVLFRRSDKK